jgi:hypothetical protein
MAMGFALSGNFSGPSTALHDVAHTEMRVPNRHSHRNRGNDREMQDKKLTRLEADLLVGAVTALLAAQSKPVPDGYGYAAEKRISWDAAEGLVRCTPGSWAAVDTSDPAERMRISRAYASLERRGLVERVSQTGRQITHLAPTAAGMAMAATLTTEADRG